MADPPGITTTRVKLAERALETVWRKGLMPRPRLADLLTRSERLDQGGGEWREPLLRLIEALQGEARLNPVGLTFAYAQLSALLDQRARAHALWRRHPEIAKVPVTAPVIVLGHMRSGTTRVQRLLGCDDRFAHTRFHEVMRPIAPALDTRIVQSWAQLKLLDWLNPALRAVHPTSATAVEEAFGLLSFSLYGAQIEAQWRVPAFAAYWQGQDKTWVYREFKLLLQTLAWQRRGSGQPGAADRPWVLKAPQFMEDLAVLLDTFPDARLICLSRDPADIVISSASLVRHQMQVQTHAPDPAWIGREWLGKTVWREQRCRSALRARPAVPRIDTGFAAMNRDWRGQMEAIYAFLGMELTPAVSSRMERYLARAERSGFRAHSYRAEDFTLSREAVRQQFVTSKAV